MSSERPRAHLEELVRKGKVPGLQYVVVAPEQVVFEYAGGFADIAGARQVTATTTMMAYSMSKTITAAAVLQLVDVPHFGHSGPDPAAMGPPGCDT